jgi:hypothetical protein
MTTNEIEEIQRLERELHEKKRILASKQNTCNHEWSDVKYDPEEILEEYLTGGYSGSGVDKWPNTAYRKVKKDRWSRTCVKCGMIEYSYEKRATKYEPYFK